MLRHNLFHCEHIPDNRHGNIIKSALPLLCFEFRLLSGISLLRFWFLLMGRERKKSILEKYMCREFSEKLEDVCLINVLMEREKWYEMYLLCAEYGNRLWVWNRMKSNGLARGKLKATESFLESVLRTLLLSPVHCVFLLVVNRKNTVAITSLCV